MDDTASSSSYSRSDQSSSRVRFVETASTSDKSSSGDSIDLEKGFEVDTEKTTDNNENKRMISSKCAASTRLLSSSIGDKESGAVDAQRIGRAVRDAGLYSFGIVAVELWILDERFGRLVRADGGWWRSPIFPRSDALERLEDSQRSDYANPLPQIPGAGLAGLFWTLSSANQSSHAGRHPLTWVDLRSILADPDQPPYLRMRLLEEAGFGKATGVPFNVRGHQGVVLYLARASASDAALKEELNDEYLRSSTEFIGAASALTKPRTASVEAKLERNRRSFRRAKIRFQAVRAFSQLSLKSNESDDSNRQMGAGDRPAFQKSRSIMRLAADNIRRSKDKFVESVDGFKSDVRKRMFTFQEKCRGGNLRPPPQMTTQQALWSFIGPFLTMMILSRLSSLIETLTDDEYSIILGPFGALMALQYGLTAAPAAQPRNALYGQIMSVSIALVLKLATENDEEHFPVWLRMALAVSISVSAMAKFGITHPPAASSALIFSTRGSADAIFFILLLFGNVVAATMATIINNLSSKRQYPIYWAFGLNSCPGVRDFSISV